MGEDGGSGDGAFCVWSGGLSGEREDFGGVGWKVVLGEREEAVEFVAVDPFGQKKIM